MTRAQLQPEEKEFAFSERDFRFLTEWVNARTGIVLAAGKRNMVYSRLSRRLRALGFSNFSEYCALIQSEAGEEEAGNLVNAITTNLTSFFREKHHFEHLREQTEQLLAGGAKRLRIWSAGCSSGMETYSIAMSVNAALRGYVGVDVRILATDIDTNMLATGEKGEYPLGELEHIPKEYHGGVTVNKAQQTMTMQDELRQMIAFKRLNLLEAWPMKGPFDVIFCRNVVIYFDKPTQKELFARYAALLKPQGWLYIGHSENLQNVCDRFTLTGRTIYRKNT